MMMDTDVKQLLDDIARMARDTLGKNLIGSYLHGSLAMGCFQKDKSDIDLLFVVDRPVEDREKLRFMDEIVRLNARAPEKGIEMSVVRAEVLKPFVHPTPFELHFSISHIAWWQRDPAGYIAGMRGDDPDLAAHCTILNHRGIALDGPPIGEVFGEVSRAAYFDSIWGDVSGAEEDIAENPVYVILNLCRVRAYAQAGKILSKKEGGEWGMANVAAKYVPLVAAATEAYRTGKVMAMDETLAKEYAGYILETIHRATPEKGVQGGSREASPRG